MKLSSLLVTLLALTAAPGAFAGLLYDNTAIDTLHTLIYSVGPYTGIGDQIQLTAPGNAVTALLQLYNAGGPGNFDAELRFYETGGPVGAQLGGVFTLPGVFSTGGDI